MNRSLPPGSRGIPELVMPGRQTGNIIPEEDGDIVRECNMVSRQVHILLIEQLAATTPEESRDQIVNALNVVDTMLSATSSKDRNILMGALNMARSNQGKQAPVSLHLELQSIIDHPENSPEIKRVASSLYNLMQKLGINPEDSNQIQREQAFAGDIFLYLRVMDPFGVNILDPQQEGKIKSAIDLTKGALIMFGGGDISLRVFPIENGTCKGKITQRASPSAQSEASSIDVEIPDGMPLYVGRPLVISGMFDRKFGIPIQFPIDVTCTHPKMSRGACMIVRKGDRLYVFDRGSRNPITVYSDDGGVEYEPVSHVLPDGTINFGDSQMLTMEAMQRMLSDAANEVLKR